MSLELNKNPKGSFIFIDDDNDEHILFKLAMKELKLNNRFHSFLNGAEALSFLKETKEEIFVIISDVNMPTMDGLELKRMIELLPEVKVKAIPFFYHSNTSLPTEIKTAYTLNIQGYLRKAKDLDGTIESLRKVVDLWTDCIHPKDLKRL